MPQKRFRRYQRRFSPYGSAASLILWEIAAGRAPNAWALPLRKEKAADSAPVLPHEEAPHRAD